LPYKYRKGPCVRGRHGCEAREAYDAAAVVSSFESIETRQQRLVDLEQLAADGTRQPTLLHQRPILSHGHEPIACGGAGFTQKNGARKLLVVTRATLE
jgi:hypothetical protein